MNYQCTLLAVRDMERSKRFYCDLLGMTVTADFGANVTLSDRIALQTFDTWKSFIQREENSITLGHNSTELYFEESNMDGFLARLAETPGIEYVHPPKEHSWGQRVVRFYDPDRHIIEVGENMGMMVKRFLDSGLSAEETAKRMDVPVEYVQSCIEGLF
ncbi:MAG: glyoxalase [Ruminococcaceae bacterium]|nr:glyoxalase [Oscillospiraceae bacterium]